jgi:hypothetical protein
MMTRIIRNFALACLALFSTGALAQGITVGSGQGLRGQTVNINVNFTAGADIAGIEFDLNFNQTLFSLVAVDCSGSTVGGIDSCSVVGGTVNMNFADSSALSTGLMGVVSFTIAANAAYGATALDGVIQSLSDSGGQDLDPGLFSPVDGTLTVLGPTYSSTPAAGALNVGSAQQGAASPSVNVTIDNTGAAGSTLTGTCTETADVDNVFTLSGDTSFSVPEAGPNDVVTVSCSTATQGSFGGTMSCAHNGTNASPQVYNLSCEITAGPEPSFSSTPAPGTIDLGPVDEGSAAPTQNISISNNGDPGTTLTGTCSFTAGDTGVITLTSDGAFSVLQGGAADIQTVSCSTANEGAFSATLTCPHNGSNGPNALFTVNCTIDPPPAPEYSSVPAIGATLDFGGTATEEGDPDPTDSISITNTGDPGSELDATCTDSVDPDGVFTVSGGVITDLLPTGGAQVVTVTCDSANQGSYTGTLSCDHNGETATDPATYSLSCEIGPPGAAIFASNPVPGSTIDLTDGGAVAEGENVAPKSLTFFNNSDPGDSSLQVLCSLSGDAPPLSVSPDISGGVTIAPGANSAVSFDCATAADGSFTATYSCEYDLGIDGPPECPDGGIEFDCDGTASYTVTCDVRDPISIVLPVPPSGTSLEALVPPGGSHVFAVDFQEVADEAVDATLEFCTLDGGTNFSILSPTFPANIPAGGSVTVQVEGSDPGGVDQITDVLRCTYSDSNHPYNGDNELGVEVVYNLTLIFGGNASFAVEKIFTDGNPGEVLVTISCNTGLPLEQSKLISQGDGVKFIVGDFDSGEMDCSVTEAPVSGYSATYDASNSASNSEDSDPENPGCHYFEVGGGDDNFCIVTNTPDPVDVVITKEWVFEGSSVASGIDTRYDLTLFCDAEIVGGQEVGGPAQEAPEGFIGGFCGLVISQEAGQTQSANDWCKVFSGDGPDTFVAEVIPEYPDSHCHVVERVFDDAVEVDNGCQDIVVSAGNGDSCTVTNTVFFEGIPTLSQYGLAILALLMLGIGLVGFRRFA